MYFNKNYLIIYLILILFFIIPFFFWDYNYINIGGDSSGIFFLFPEIALKNIGLSVSNNLTGHIPNNSHFPFYSLILLLNFIVKNPAITFNIVLSIQLSLSFLFFLLLSKEINKIHKVNTDLKFIFIFALCYSLSPIILYEHTIVNPLYSRFLVLIFPLILLITLKFIKTNNYTYILFQNIFLILFSVSLSLINISFLIFFVFMYLLFLIYLIRNLQLKLPIIFKRIIIYFFLTIGSLSFFLLTEAAYLINYIIHSTNISEVESLNLRNIFKESNAGSSYFKSIAKFISIKFALLNYPPEYLMKTYDHQWRYFLSNYLYSSIYIVILFFYLIGRIYNKIIIKNVIYLEIIFIISLGLYVGSIPLFSDIYMDLFKIPFFIAIRSFYAKFAILYTLFFCLFLSVISNDIFKYINYIIDNIRIKFENLFGKNLYFIKYINYKIIKNFFLLFLLLTVIINCKSFLTGKVYNEYFYYGEPNYLEKADPKYFIKTFDYYINKKEYFKGLYLPPARIKNIIFTTKNNGNYIGPNFFDFLSIHNITTSADTTSEINSFNLFLHENPSKNEIKNDLIKNKYSYIFINKNFNIGDGYTDYVDEIKSNYKKNIKIIDSYDFLIKEYEDENLNIYFFQDFFPRNFKINNHTFKVKKDNKELLFFLNKMINLNEWQIQDSSDGNSLIYKIKIHKFLFFGIILTLLSILITLYFVFRHKNEYID